MKLAKIQQEICDYSCSLQSEFSFFLPIESELFSDTFNSLVLKNDKYNKTIQEMISLAGGTEISKDCGFISINKTETSLDLLDFEKSNKDEEYLLEISDYDCTYQFLIKASLPALELECSIKSYLKSSSEEIVLLLADVLNLEQNISDTFKIDIGKIVKKRMNGVKKNVESYRIEQLKKEELKINNDVSKLVNKKVLKQIRFNDLMNEVFMLGEMNFLEEIEYEVIFTSSDYSCKLS